MGHVLPALPTVPLATRLAAWPVPLLPSSSGDSVCLLALHLLSQMDQSALPATKLVPLVLAQLSQIA